jgi:peptidoglycan/xylan/chitin deacetylase (PgdA/CDA1 family)
MKRWGILGGGAGAALLMATACASQGSGQARRTVSAIPPVRPAAPPIAAAGAQSIPTWARGATLNSVEVPKDEKVIALTFDDGPLPRYTHKVLEILKAHDAHATFFMLGSELASSPSVGKEVRDAGHAIGNHSWSHPIRTKDPAGEVGRTDKELKSLLGVDTTLFRPPYGILKNGLAHAARARGEAVLIWSVDTNDWKRPGASAIASRVIRGAHPGAIVLMHDGGGNRSQTVAALPTILDTLGQKGYRFVTVPELLRLGHQAASTPKAVASKSVKAKTKR